MHSLTISPCFVLVHETVNKQCVPVLTSAGAVAVGNRLVYQSLCGANTVMCLMIKQHVILGYIYTCRTFYRLYPVHGALYP